MVNIESVHGDDKILTPTQLFFTVLGGLFMTLAFFGNAAVIAVIIRSKKLQTLANYAILNLSVADCIFGMTGIISFWSNTATGRWNWDWQCIMDGTFGLLLVTVSILTLVLIAIERYMHIVKEIKIQSSWKTTLALLLTWFVGWWPSSLPLYGVNRYRVQPNNIWCTADWTMKGSDIVAPVFFIVLISVSVGILMFAYGSIFLKVRRVTNLIRSHTQNRVLEAQKHSTPPSKGSSADTTTVSSASSSIKDGHAGTTGTTGIPTAEVTAGSSTPASPTTDASGSNHDDQLNAELNARHIDQYERKATLRMLTIVVSFCLFWTPALLYIFYETITGEEDDPGFMYFVDWGTTANPAFNPFIYAYFDPYLRDELKRILLCRWHHHRDGSTNSPAAGAPGANEHHSRSGDRDKAPHGSPRATAVGSRSAKASGGSSLVRNNHMTLTPVDVEPHHDEQEPSSSRTQSHNSHADLQISMPPTNDDASAATSPSDVPMVILSSSA